MSKNSFFSELRKRKVVQVAAIYGAVAWGVTEVVVTVANQLFLPNWVSTLAVIGFVVGFPVAMFLAWTFDITPEGIRRTTVDSRRGKASIVLSLVLLVAGTAGLFLLIKPALEGDRGGRALSVAPDSIAVLPFENSSGDADTAYLSEGVSDELRDQLGRIPGLRIAARSSSVAARQLASDAVTSAARLGVAHLVEGSVRRRGNTLRVSVQLIEGATGLAVWSETFERGPRELLGVQQQIAEQIVRRVLPEAVEVVAAPATRNADANELMLLARHYEQSALTRESVDEAMLLKAATLYRQATEADPQSALAHSRLAGTLLWLGDLEAAEAPIFRALSLNPGLSEVQHTLGLYYYARGLPEARTAFQRAVELNPNNADALSDHAHSFYVEGISDGVEELYRRALELDPLSLARYGALGQFLGTAQDSREEILELAEQVEDRFKGADAMLVIARLQELAGNVDQAIAWTLRARELDTAKADYADRLAELYADIGDFDTALRITPEPGVGLLFKMRRYRELIDIAELLVIDEPEDLDLRYLLAFAHQAVGQFESALWVLVPTGLPDSVMGNARRSADWEGFFTQINAALGAGDVEVAQGFAQWFVDDPTHFDTVDWWSHTYFACALSVIGRYAEALERIERVRGSHRVPWDPVLRDSFCFQNLQDHPVYQETLAVFDRRRAELRARLPATLAAFGVSLQAGPANADQSPLK